MSTLPTLWNHQKECIAKADKVDNLALFMSPGTGKSRTLIEILRNKCVANDRVLRTLILCPLIVTRNWQREFEQYLPKSIIPKKVKVLTGTIKEKAATLVTDTNNQIFIVNYDAFINPDFTNAVIKFSPEILVLDESHRVKNPSSKRTKALIKVSEKMRANKVCHRYLLTGTPVTNDQMDLWAQFYVLDNGKTLGDSFFGYRAKYFWDLNAAKKGSLKYFPMFVPKKNIEQELNAKISGVSFVAKKEDCLDLPPLVKTIVPVELSSQQARLYKQMKEDFITFLGDKACTASLAITKSLRMQQIISGFIKLEGDEKVTRLENPRANVLMELLENIVISNKCLVWASFREDYATIREVCEKLGVRYVELTGEISQADKFKNVDTFNNDPDIKVLIGSPGAGGIGINLVAASYSIWYSRTFNMEQDLQAEARNFRGGSEIHEKITRYDLVATGTLDELIMESLKNKVDLKDKIMSINTKDI